MPSEPYPRDVRKRFVPTNTNSDVRQYGQTRDGHLYQTHKGVRNVSTDRPPENDEVSLRQAEPDDNPTPSDA